MAPPSDAVAAASATALLSVIAADGRVITLPPEIVDMILEHLRKSKSTLSLIMCTSKSMFDRTIKLFWETATLDVLNKLSTAHKTRRQRYAGVIREIKFTIGPNQILPPLHGIMFSQLKRLAITHDSMEPMNEPKKGCHVNLAQFMVPSLTEVRLNKAFNSVGDCSLAKLTAGNFLPHLARNCPQLETLALDAQVYAATSADLVNVLRACRKLKDLGLGTSTDELTKGDCFAHIVAHPRLRALHQWFGPSPGQINSALKQVSKPALDNLTDVDMIIDAGHITLLLPHLFHLKRLRLVLEPAQVSVFPFLSHMTTLVTLDIWVEPSAIPLTGADLEKIFPLKNLKYFHFSGYDNDILLPHPNIAGLIQPSTRPCELHKLEIMTIGGEDSWHFRPQLLTIAQTARNLDDLLISGPFDFRLMESSERPLFPELRKLKPYTVSEVEMPGTTVTEQANFLASLLSRHAPKLERLWFGGGTELAKDVMAAWEALHEDRPPEMWDGRSYAAYPSAPLGPRASE
ncbi:hypothetical protein KCU65_g5733, partial [Aureobasidium melanogenum]